MIYRTLLSPPAFANYVVSFLAGALSALVVPTLSLHLAQTYKISAWQIGVFFIGKAVASILFAQLIARKSDHLSDRRPLIAAALACGGLSCFLFAEASSFNHMLLIATTIFGLSFSGNAQLMAQTREFADAQLRPNQATLFNSIVRACIAVAWIAGPPIGFILLTQLGFTIQCRIVGSAYFIAALISLFVLPKITPRASIPTASPKSSKQPLSRTLLGGIIAFSLMFGCNASYQIALPLMIQSKLHADPAHAGFIMGTAALLEIPLMILAGWLGSRMPLLPLIRIGAAAAVVLYLGIWQASAVWQLFVLQIFNAVFIGFIAGLGMTWFQNLLPGQAGLSSSYFSNSSGLGEIIGYLIIALIAQNIGYGGVYGFTGLVAFMALAVLLGVCRKAQNPL
jgi:MFS transporter, SET family, sugar efflux transporter